MPQNDKISKGLQEYWNKILNGQSPAYSYPSISSDNRTKELRDWNYNTQKTKEETKDNLESLKHNNFWTQPYSNFSGQQAAELGNNLAKPVVATGLLTGPLKKFYEAVSFLKGNPELVNNMIGSIAAGAGTDIAYEKVIGKPAQLGESLDVQNPYTRELLNFISPGAAVGASEVNQAAGAVSNVTKKYITPLLTRLTDSKAAKEAVTQYFSPFGYQLFDSYDGKVNEALRYMRDYILKGKKKPDITWYDKRIKFEPKRTQNRLEAFRKYLGIEHPEDDLYISNGDGTWSYNPKRIPKENIEYQRQKFREAGNGNTSQEYLTTDLDGPKGTRSGNAGGLTSKIDDEGNFIIDDLFDLQPLLKYKWLPKNIREIEAGRFIGGKPFRVHDTNIGKVSNDNMLKTSQVSSNHEPYYTKESMYQIVSSGRPRYLDDIVEGKKEFVDWITDPRYKEVAEHNQELASRLGLKYIPTYDKPEYKYLQEQGIAPKFKLFKTDDGDIDTHTGALTSMFGHSGVGPEQITYNLASPMSYRNVTRHEVGHVARHGDTRVGADIDESVKMQERRFNQKVIDKVLQPGKGEVGPYDFRTQHGETIMNGRDLGRDMGIETFQEYPGYEKALEIIKNHINDYNNGKVKSSKIRMFKVLNIEDKKSMPYIWKLLNGTLLGAGTISIGNNINE